MPTRPKTITENLLHKFTRFMLFSRDLAAIYVYLLIINTPILCQIVSYTKINSIMSVPKLRILCLHGKQQNKEVFRTKLGRIPHKLRNIAELTIVDAPHVLDTESTSDLIARTWFYRDSDNNVDVNSLLNSMEYLRKTWNELGPFDGVLGFSMGGTVASFLAGHLCRSSDKDNHSAVEAFPGLRFVICAGAVDIHPQLESSIEALQLPLLCPFKIPPEIASLHIAGSADTAVPIASSIALSDRYNQAMFIQHEQGHHIPMKAPILQVIVDFVSSQQVGALEPQGTTG